MEVKNIGHQDSVTMGTYDAELKQQLHELPKKIVEEIKDKIPEIGGMKCEIIIDDSLTLNTLLDTILKKYGDKNESNND